MSPLKAAAPTPSPAHQQPQQAASPLGDSNVESEQQSATPSPTGAFRSTPPAPTPPLTSTTPVNVNVNVNVTAPPVPAAAVPASTTSSGGSVSSLSSEQMQWLQSLSSSRQFLPEPSDTTHSFPYIPRNPYRTPPYFPQQPAPIFQNTNATIFEKFGADTLFFIFYFQQGTPQQYLAGRELKKQSWRYHKGNLTWFQRHDDPTTTTDDYEQGTYVFFDYEAGWCQRIRSDFVFEYKFLEDDYTPKDANSTASPNHAPPDTTSTA